MQNSLRKRWFILNAVPTSLYRYKWLAGKKKMLTNFERHFFSDEPFNFACQLQIDPYRYPRNYHTNDVFISIGMCNNDSIRGTHTQQHKMKNNRFRRIHLGYHFGNSIAIRWHTYILTFLIELDFRIVFVRILFFFSALNVLRLAYIVDSVFSA